MKTLVIKISTHPFFLIFMDKLQKIAFNIFEIYISNNPDKIKDQKIPFIFV
jgi:hypothetical protein